MAFWKKNKKKKKQKAEVINRREFEEFQKQVHEIRKELRERMKKQEEEHKKQQEKSLEKTNKLVSLFKSKFNQFKRRARKELENLRAMLNIEKELENLDQKIKQIETKLETKAKEAAEFKDDVWQWYTNICKERNELEAEMKENKIDAANVKDGRLIVVMGKTGVGKSTLLNRFTGDTTELGDDEKGFQVSEEFDSCTQRISCKKTMNRFDNQVCYCVDTPGSYDSNGDDAKHEENLATFLKGCGGVNAFVVVFSLAEPRLDQSFIDLLKRYSAVLNDDLWWENVILVGTKRDNFLLNSGTFRKMIKDKDETEISKIATDFVVQRTNLFKSKLLANEELKIPDHCVLPCIACGHDNYEDPMKELTEMIGCTDVGGKFNCENISFASDIEYTKKMDVFIAMHAEIDEMEKEKERLEDLVKERTQQKAKLVKK